ncbi:DMT family transporter [Glaciihabitans sp. dw_435]|uniref:EamA family transporter n=1 Tax=Glaciihabitans sp. dw_435 TaxID=2720081 RepID=UPI0027DD75FA|nr:DMT family transporter [Glaciihabitans sp. dw_435]
MQRTSVTTGLVIAVIAALTFGASGALVKPLLESGWSPAAAVTARALIGGVVLSPIAVLSLRGNWNALWRGRWRVLGMGLIGVAGTQLAYFASLQRIPIGTAVLLEYMAPILLVLFVWARSRRLPEVVVLAGSVVAVAGLVLVVGPAGGADVLGLVFALLAMVGCAIYYVIAARPNDGLPPVALASFGLLLGGGALWLVGLTGLVPFTAPFTTVRMFGAEQPWWIPLVIVGVVATAVAYTANITASAILGSRLASFAGLLEVIAATFYAWLLLGENITVIQLVGGALILAGIALVRSAKDTSAVDGHVAPAATPAVPQPTP